MTLLRHEVGKTFIRILQQTDKRDTLDAFDGLLEQVRAVMRDEQGVPEQKQVRTPSLTS